MMHLLFWSFFPFMTIFFKDSFGEKQAGLLLIASQAFSVFASLIGGYCADRFGRKKMMIVAAGGESFTFLLFAYANSSWLDSSMLTFIAFSLLGVFGAFYWPASHAMIADVVEERDRAPVFAVFYTSLNIAVVVGPLLGGLLFYSYRFEMFLTGAVLTGILAVVLHLYLTETSKPKLRKKEQNRSWHGAVWDELADYRVIVKDKTFLMFVLAGVLVAQTFMQLNVLIAVYISDVVQNVTVMDIGGWNIQVTGERAFALVLAENGLIVALLTVSVTKIMNRLPEKRVFILSSLIYAVAITAYGFTDSLWVFVAIMAVFTFAELMVVGIQESFVSKLAPEDKRGQYFSAASLRFTLGRLLAPVSLVLLEWMSYQMVFAILGVLSILSALTYYLMFARLEKQKKEQLVTS